MNENLSFLKVLMVKTEQNSPEKIAKGIVDVISSYIPFKMKCPSLKRTSGKC